MIVNLSTLHSRLLAYLFSKNMNDIEDFLCPLTETYDWKSDSIITEVIDGSDFGKKITSFLLKSHDSPDADNVRVIIGGIGTGKSTTINYIFKKILSEKQEHNDTTDHGNHCEPITHLLNLNFELNDEEDIDVEYTKKMGDKFWSTVTSDIQTTSKIEFDKSNHELVKFLGWCLTQKKLLNKSTRIQQFLEVSRPQINEYLSEDPESKEAKKYILKSLLKSHNELILGLDPEDFCWYMVFKYKYQLYEYQQDSCKYIYILLDNVDHLHPEVQKIAVSFAINLTEILLAKTIITIRPLTWERSSHAHTLVDIMYQHSPSINDVINKRINWFIEREQITEEEKLVLLSLTSIMTGKTKYQLPLANLFKSTSGIGVRFALRNFANMLESPFLSAINVDSLSTDPLDKLQVWQLSRAYLFGTKTHFIPHAFENLYTLENNRIFPLLKIRILDYIERIMGSNNTEIVKLVNFLEAFGYEKSDILTALNELLNRQRPLLWCNNSYKFTINNPLLVNGRLMITPIGKGYIKNLFGATEYDTQCLAKTGTEFVGIEELDDFHKDEVVEADLNDIEKYCSNFSADMYKRLYPKDYISISYMHWRNLEPGMKNLSKSTNYYFDPNRSEWIKSKVDALLNYS